MEYVSLLGAVKHNPMFFMLAIVLGVASMVMAVVALVAMLKKTEAARLLAMLACGGALLTGGAGVVGWLHAGSQVDAALAYPGLTEVEKTMMRTAGQAEAAYNLWFALAVAALPLLLGVVAAVGAKSKTSD